ncbi:MAG: membrane protein insertion efficiency factor YidD [Microbacterium sp.]|jgi:putative membrane protein insertion efficiency factor|uniref:Putative membrane protein insertion efficiency factor n=1 Tax=Microbacterium ginsengisoli TaxID=400772 RepID=A0A0F0LUG1_9MICO|nr:MULTISPECIES: membrane protein insertion efficiency factor YidD [Microbacterium]MAL05604.1 membrane protein insertion efficiency factor YidD [Microbacterium sp.]MCK9919561.1 membrane protein insertion efficiency factor YidD [Microbacteriaceae bacterium K1510]KJL35940.1 putative membrane protein insertion efficiency factor [Microbacterium ginsengisoli]KQR92075.1 membrane protein insertion efficiency factor YidD [Microbacterium sp. Leaf347]KQS05835.1 membrane protein insertion efficiency fact|tara:strand:- start:820 stop:1176 length:357 start_codon:yes stop_codon:yes gene_type:complete
MSSATLPSHSRGTDRFDTRLWLRAVPLVPRNLGLALLHGYRATISHVYGDVCKYYPSCSAYAVGAVQQHGLVKGSALAAARIARCHPWAAGGVDDPPTHAHYAHALTPHGFVVPLRKD